MKIAILGGGYTGLSASYYLAKKGHKISLFEKEKTLGGLATGFKQPNWNWYLERAYHHLLSSEDDILSFAEETKFDGIFFQSPETASLYKNSIYPLDTPLDLLKFPLLSIPAKIRAGMILVFLKTSPYFSFYEKQTAGEFLQKTMGKEAWKVLWQELFRKKFGKYAENILASFIWARIKKRSKRLGYIQGGFQTFTDYIEKQLKSLKVNVLTGYEIRTIMRERKGFIINNTEKFDAVVSTLPTPVIVKLGSNSLPQDYLSQLKKLEYLHAVVLILETKKPILEKTYWLNICDKNIPIMILCQHTNFIDKKNYGGNHLAYVGWYVSLEDRIWKMDDRELLKFVLPHIRNLTNYELRIANFFHFRGPFAQPIYDKNFLKNKPEFITPVKNFFMANLDMTYPYDRGTNYAVKLGREVSKYLT